MRFVLAALVGAAALYAAAMEAGARAAASGCPHDASLGSVAYLRGTSLRLLDLGSCRDRVLVPAGAEAPVRFLDRGRRVAYGSRVVSIASGRSARWRPAQGILSPDGHGTAEIRVDRKRGAGRGTESIWVRDHGRRGHAAYTLKESYRDAPAGSPGPLMLLGWSGDSKWIFFAIDPLGSASLAADGMELRVVRAAGGKPVSIASGLLHDDYRTWCNRRLIFVAGNDRIATNNKRLMVAEPPQWRPRPLWSDPGRAVGSVVCAPDGQSVTVLSQPNRLDYNFLHTRWALWQVRLDGSRKLLDTPPAGSADESPRWSHDGRSLLFVRKRRGAGELMLLEDRHVRALASLGASNSYYGHDDWWGRADWYQPA